jgi:sodium/potassium-transporting ATPase subunit alpha
VVKKEDIVADFADSLFETEAMKLARTDLILVGIVGIVDPPREEIPYVVSTLRGAGIRFFMVSIIAGLCAIY